MGMSATQARYLSLIAQQNDLEFQGQQINESRTTLSEQTNNLYTQLQNMDVPVPPMTNDYTTLVYKTSDGALNYTLGTIRPSSKSTGSYNMDLTFSNVGDSLNQSNTTASISYLDDYIKVGEVTRPTKNQPTGKYNETDVNPSSYVSKTPIAGSSIPENANPSNYMVKNEDGTYQVATQIEADKDYYEIKSSDDYEKLDEDAKANWSGIAAEMEPVEGDFIVNAAELGEYYVLIAGDETPIKLNDTGYAQQNSDGSFTINLPEGAKLYKLGEGSDELKNPHPGELLIGGNTAMTWDEVKNNSELHDKINWSNYETAISHTFGKDAKLDDFYFVITPSKSGAYDVQLYKKEDVPTNVSATGLTTKGFTYSSGTYTETVNYDYVDIQFDASGRILKIIIPNTDEIGQDGKPTSWKELDVSASSATDEEAYNNAMAEYEHAKYKYDKDQTAINAQMSIIQAEDKKLELKLQRLDTERTQITTEIDALKKVLQDNIEASYKTFSG